MSIRQPVGVFLLMLFGMAIWGKGVQAQDKVGTSAAPFLGINIGAAATAMGGAYVSLARDASTIYWNPGATSRLEHSVANFTHTKWFVNTSYNWAGVVLKMGGANALGLNLAILDYGEEEVTTVHYPEGTGERWSAQDLFASISYARNLTDRFSIGGAVKIIQQKIFHEVATGYAVDIGLLYITRFNGMRLGMSIQNFGTEMQLDGKDLIRSYDMDPNHLGNNPNISSKLRTQSWPIPLFYRVGVSMDVVRFGGGAIMLATDALIPSDNSTVLNAGMELRWNKVFFLRAGYKSILREETQEGLTAGLGIHYFIPGLGRVSMDYAYNDYGLLQAVHVLGLGFEF